MRGPDEVSLSGRPLTVEITATTKKIPNTLALYINENDGTNIGANGRIGVILVTSESKTLPPVIRVRVTFRARQVATAFATKRSHAVAVAPHSRAKNARARASATVTGHRHFWELDLETWNKPALKALTLAVTRTATDPVALHGAGPKPTKLVRPDI